MALHQFLLSLGRGFSEELSLLESCIQLAVEPVFVVRESTWQIGRGIRFRRLVERNFMEDLKGRMRPEKEGGTEEG